MIQRIQTVWLLVAGLVAAGIFYFDLFSITYMQDGKELTKGVSIMYNYLLSILGFSLVAAPLITITQFKKRKVQSSLALVAIILNVVFLAFYLFSTNNFSTTVGHPIESLSYTIGSFLPLVSIIFLILAIRAIKKDEKLVKSLDRLR